MLFETAATDYMAEKSKRLRANTLAGYESAIRAHLMPMWSGREVEEITHDEIQAWVDGIAQPGAAHKAYKTLRQVIRWCIRKGLVVMPDPTACGVELPAIRRHTPDTLDAGEQKAVLRALWGHECEAVAICALASRRCRLPANLRRFGS